MSRKGEAFSGLTTALITPFKDGKVDEAQLCKLIDMQIDAGTDCIAPCGTTGESPTLTHDEHEQVVKLTCQHAAGRIKVVAGTGSNSTSEAIRLTQAALEAGADGALMVTPYYNKPMQEGFYQHYKAVAEAVEIPIMLYNIPGRSAKNMEPETICRLGELKNIVAVKEATGSMDQASAILADSDLTVLSGDDSLTLPLLSLGGSGIVSVVGNLIPKDVKAMLNAFHSGDLAEAQRRHHELFRLCRSLLSLATNPIPVKAAMKLMGLDTGDLRLPMTPLTAEQEASLKQTLIKSGLLPT